MIKQKLQIKLLVMRFFIVFLLFMPMQLFLLAPAWAGNLVLTTYYPAPQGDYDRITLVPQNVNLASSCTIGTLISDAVTGNPYYCHDIGGSGTWGSLNNTWVQINNNVYPIDTSVNPLIFMGIGTTTPQFKLTLNNDGGILAMGTLGSGTVVDYNFLTSLRTIPANRFLWYPRKAAFRAMEDSSGLTDDGAMNNYSVAFGKNNQASGLASTASGQNNSATGDYATIHGGNSNSAQGNYSTVTGGQQNSALGVSSVVSGMWNIASGTQSTIGGGWCNFTTGSLSTILGGDHNNEASFDSCTPHPTTTTYMTISGGRYHSVFANYTTILGGYNQQAHSDYVTLGGGRDNHGEGNYSYIGGGLNNTTQGDYSAIGGGNSNNAAGAWSVIGGGVNNSTSNNHNTILGGNNNNTTGISTVIMGGANHNITGNADYSVIAGGGHHAIASSYSWAGGRHMNMINTANKTFVWGYSDVAVDITAADAFILAPGTVTGLPVNPKLGVGAPNPSAVLSITAPTGNTNDYLAITSTSAASAGNIFMVKANGKVGIGNHNPQYPLQIGNIAGPLGILTNGGAWTTTSSRTYKENIKPAEPQEAINVFKHLHPVTYNYKINKAEHHAGFIAEDVPNEIAVEGRNSVNAMNINAVLATVLKNQKSTLQKQADQLNQLDHELRNLKATWLNHIESE